VAWIFWLIKTVNSWKTSKIDSVWSHPTDRDYPPPKGVQKAIKNTPPKEGVKTGPFSVPFPDLFYRPVPDWIQSTKHSILDPNPIKVDPQNRIPFLFKKMTKKRCQFRGQKKGQKFKEKVAKRNWKKTTKFCGYINLWTGTIFLFLMKKIKKLTKKKKHFYFNVWRFWPTERFLFSVFFLFFVYLSPNQFHGWITLTHV